VFFKLIGNEADNDSSFIISIRWKLKTNKTNKTNFSKGENDIYMISHINTPNMKLDAPLKIEIKKNLPYKRALYSFLNKLIY